MTLAATAGTGSTSDFGAIQYLNGSTWTNYSAGNIVQIPSTGSTLLVRVAITNDRIFETSETFNLVATTTGGSSKTGVGTIKDDGSGDLFSSTNTTGIADAAGIVDAKGTTTTADDVTLALNDDRMVDIESIIANEGSPYAVFNIIGGFGAQFNLTLAAVGNTVIGATNDGTNDVNDVIQYWTGTTWLDVGANGLVTMPSATNLLVRVALYNQTAFEGPQQFSLIVTDTANVVRGTGLATIKDDGTGNIFTGNATITDPSAAFASATTDAQKQSALEAWRAANFEKSRWIISGFHGAFYKAEGGGYYISGERASSSGSSLSVPQLVSSGNGYSYTGTIIDVAVPSSTSTQYLLLTTEGLYAWGNRNIGVLTSSVAFQKITTPAEFIFSNVKSMTASNMGVMFLMKDGTVRSVSINESTHPSGHPAAGGDYSQVLKADGTALSGITDLEYYRDSAFAYSASENKFYTWGSITYLGDDSVTPVMRTVATEMTPPSLPAGVSVVQIGVTYSTYYVLGSDGKVYVMGANNYGAAGQDSTSVVPTWTTMRDSTGAANTSITNVQFLSAQNSSYYSGGRSSAVAVLLKDGSVLAAGSNDNNMAGAPFTGFGLEFLTAPMGSIVGKPAFTVETGGHFSSVLLYGCEGVISATGHNPGGAFGDGTTSDRTAYVETLFLGALDTACITPIVLSNPTVAQLEDHRPDDSPLTINDVEVNEGSPYAVFTVTGEANQYVSLDLEPTTNANSNAFLGIDTGTVLEYFNGTSWVVYEPGTFARIPSTGTNLLVRVGIVNDDFSDNAETFKLVAGNTYGATVTGIGTILDNGTGTIFNADGSANTAAVKNDDTGQTQSLAINNLTVNEGSPYAVFTLTGPPNLTLSNLVLSDTANSSLNATGAGGIDYGTSLQFWNGTAWTTYNTGDTVNLNDVGQLFVRTAIASDTTSDNAETFNLTATPTTGTAVTGTATILDDGSGTLFTSGNPIGIAPATVTPPTTAVVSSANASALANDDRPLAVNSLTVNEGSPYAVFTVTGVTGQYTSLSLTSGAAAVGTDTGSVLQYFDGSSWQTYSAGSFVQIPSGGLLVRVAITNDTPADNGEKFNLVARNTGGGIATGVGTIKDDGTGTIFTAANPTGSSPATLTPPTPVNGAVSAANAVNLPNDDRAIGVNNLTVNEGSPFAVFTVTGGSGQFVKLATSADTTDPAGASDYGSTLQYYNGTTWVSYTPDSYVQIPADGTPLLVRAAIYNDIASDSGETFNLVVTNLNGDSATGVGTIMDDGTGNLYSASNITGITEDPGQNGLPAEKDDELAVEIRDVVVRECSPYIVFTLDGGYGQLVKLSLAAIGNTKIGSSNDGANDLNNKLQYWDAAANNGAGTWADYDDSVGVSIPAANDLLVRVALYDQVDYEGPESVRLTVTGAGGVVRGAGLATIRDDGVGDVFTGYVTSIDASAAYAAALSDANATAAQKQAALDAWRQINFEKSHLISAGFHGAFYKAEGGGYYVAGENASPTGGYLLEPILVTPGNGYNYTGSIIDVAIASSRDQYLLLTTDGLYVWGKESRALVTSSVDFQRVSTPSEFIAADVKAMTASATGAMFLMKDGTVRSVTLAGNSGHPSTGDFTRVVVDDTTGAPLTGITDLEYSYNTAFAYSASADKFYTWGTKTYLGDGTPFAVNTVAVEMARPFTLASGVKVVQIGVSENTYFVLGSDGKVYVTGANTSGSAGQNSTTEVLSWTTMRDTTGVAGTSLGNVQFISAQNSTAGSYGGGINMLLKNGSILGAGSNSLSMLGTPISSTDINVQLFDKVLIPTAPTGSIVGQVAYTVETGGHFSSVLLYGCAGVISATGHNPGGAFGDGSTIDRLDYEAGLFLGNLAEACITPAVVASNTLTGLCDDRPVTVSDLTVNEGSPYAVFKVGGVEGQSVSLALATGTGTSGTDYTAALEYWNGTSWVGYTAGSLVVIPSDGDGNLGEAANLLVRVAITNDDDRDDGETFKLQASNTGGLTVTGTATIKDDGSGNLFSINNNTGDTDSPTGVGDLPASKDNDQGLRIDNLTVNEGSPYAVFKVQGLPNQVVSSLALTDGTADVDANGDLPSDGTKDYGPDIEYWDPTANSGSGAWVPYVSGNLTLDATGNLLVRTAIVGDGASDNGETFNLTAVSGILTAVGVATIKDDGTGTQFTSGNPTGTTPATTPAPTPVNGVVSGANTSTLPNDDRPLTVTNITVNEGSPYAVLSVGGIEGQYVKLSLTEGSAKVDSNGTPVTDGSEDYDPALEYWNGSAWVGYIPNSFVQIPSDSDGPTGEAANLLVRIAIINDTAIDNTQDFTLTATNTGGITNITNAGNAGIVTIKDDGTGSVFNENNNTGTPDAVDSSSLDDDRNTAPAGTNKTITISEDGSHAYTAADFGFTDANDSPANSFDSLIITSLPAKGVLTFDGNAVQAGDVIAIADIGKLVYAPVANQNGANYTSFTFQVKDDGGTIDGGQDTDQSPNTITINVTSTDDAFVDGNEAVTTNEDTPVSGNVIDSGLSSPDGTIVLKSFQVAGDSTTYTAGQTATIAGVGTIEIAADGSYTFTPVANYSGTVPVITYSLSDDAGATVGNVSTLAITVAAVVDLSAANDSNTTDEDTAVTGSVTGNDSTTSTGNLSYAKATDPSHGDVTVNADGSYTYTPDANWSGTDTFTYTVTDAASGETLTKTVTITVDPTDDAFVDGNEAVTTNEDTPVSGNVIDSGLSSPDGTIVLKSFQVAGDSTTYTAGQTATIAGVGTIEIAADGSYTFTPVANYSGTVPVITYSLSDDAGATVGNVSTLAITVAAVVDLSAANDSNTTDEDTAVTGSVTGNDSTTSTGNLSYAKATDPSHGDVTVNADGSYTYTPDANWSGTDTFTYTVTDAASGETLTKTVTITVDPTDDAFVDGNEAVTTNEDTPVSGNVIDSGLSSPDGTIVLKSFQVAGDSTTYTAGQTATIAGVGTIEIAADGSYTFTPVANYSGTVPVITYSLSDDAGATVGNVSTLAITVAAVVDLSAANDSNTTDEDTAVTGSVTGNDSTTSTGNLSYAKATDPSHGDVTVNADGSYTYTPDANWSGTDTFTYTVTDAASGETLTKTVTITVDPTDDAFVDGNEAVTTNEDTPVSGNVIDSGLSSPDGTIVLKSFQVAGDSTTYTAGQTATIAGVGTIEIAADGSYTFTPVANYSGTVPVITYSLSDDAGATVGNVSTLAITVAAVVDLSAANDSNTTDEDTAVTGSVTGNDSTTSTGNLSYAKATDPSHGDVTVNADGSYTYTPDANWSGTDTFTYTVTDAASGETLTKTVTITVDPTDDAFVDGNETVTVAEGSSNNIGTLISGTSSVDGPISVSSFSIAGETGVFTIGVPYTVAGKGTITVQQNGLYSFTPLGSFPDSFPLVTYTLTDGSGTDDTSTLAISLTTVDTVPPTIAITTDDTALNIGDTATITFTLSEASSDLVDGDITVSGGTLSTLVQDQNNPLVYTATFTPTAGSTTAGVIRVDSAKFTDAAGNANADGADTNNEVSITVDTVPPTIAITTDDTALNIGDTATITFTLSEASSDLVDGDITVSGGTLSTLVQDQNNPLVYTATFTPTAGSTTAGVIRVDSAKFTDAAGNANADGADTNNEVSITVDTVPPTIAITTDDTALNIGDTATITFTLSEASSDLVDGDITVSGGTLSTLVQDQNNPLVYTATFTPTAGSTTAGVIRVDSAKFTDAAGNANADGADTNNEVSITVDTVPPTIAITTDDTALNIGDTATITFTLSEASSDLVDGDITVSGGTLSTLVQDQNNPLVYTATFTPTAGSTTAGVIRVDSAKFTDAAGNANADGADTNNEVSITVDTVPPTIAITTDDTALNIGDTATITFTLSEASSDLVDGDITVSGGTLSTLVQDQNNPLVYTATFTPTAGSTTAGVIRVDSAKFTDAAGNANADGADTNNEVSITVDTVPPTIAITTDDTALNIGDTATITFTLSEASSDLVDGDITVSGGTLSTLVQDQNNPLVYTATFTPTAGSTTAGVIRVDSAKFTDAAGNANADGADTNNEVSITVDTVPPTIAITTDDTALNIGDTATITFTLSEASSDLVDGDITVSGGTLSTLVQDQNNPLVYTATFTPTAGSTTAGVIRVDSAKFTDAAGNAERRWC
jgi:VCBS repeat-containing protein